MREKRSTIERSIDSFFADFRDAVFFSFLFFVFFLQIIRWPRHAHACRVPDDYYYSHRDTKRTRATARTAIVSDKERKKRKKEINAGKEKKVLVDAITYREYVKQMFMAPCEQSWSKLSLELHSNGQDDLTDGLSPHSNVQRMTADRWIWMDRTGPSPSRSLSTRVISWFRISWDARYPIDY